MKDRHSIEQHLYRCGTAMDVMALNLDVLLDIRELLSKKGGEKNVLTKFRGVSSKGQKLQNH